MATVQDQQKRSFVESPTRGTSQYSREVVMAGGNGSIIAGVTYDEVAITYPTATTEVFTYKLATVDQATVTVTYLTASKKDISSVVKT